MTKFTESRDGVMRMTIQVSHRLDRRAIAYALAVYVGEHEETDLSELNAPRVMAIVREVLQDRGGNFWLMNVDDGVLKAAQARVRALFPG